VPPEQPLIFPFLTRKMLKFEHGTNFTLRIHHYANATGEIEILGATREGPFRFTRGHAGDLALETQDFNVPDVPIFITIRTSNSSHLRGDQYVMLNLFIDGNEHVLLTQGYISHMESVSWPSQVTQSNLPNHGLFRSVAGTDRAANTEITETVPSNVTWRFISMVFTLVTDANVANRNVHMRVTDGTNLLAETTSAQNQAASLTRVYSILAGVRPQDTSEDDNIANNLPGDMFLPEGFTIETSTTNLQVGDDFGAPRLFVEQFITP